MEKNRKIRPDTVTASSFFTVSAVMLLCIIFYRISGAEGAGYLSAPIAMLLLGYGALVTSFEKVTKRVVGSLVRRNLYKDAASNVRRILLMSFIAALVLATLCAAHAGFFANRVFHSSRSFFVLIMIIPMFLLISIQGVLRGYLSGAGIMSVSIISDMILVVLGYIFSIIASGIAHSYGLKVNSLMHVDDIAAVYGAIGAEVGICAAALVDLLFILAFYIAHLRQLKSSDDGIVAGQGIGRITYAWDYLSVCLLYGQAGLLLFVDECVYLTSAYKLRPDENGIETWGRYITQSVAICVILTFMLSVPFLKSWYRAYAGIAKKDFKSARARISSLIHFESMLVFPVVIWVMILADTLLTIIFGKADEAAVNTLVLSVISVIPGTVILFVMFIFQQVKNKLLVAIDSAAGIAVHIVVLVLMTKFSDAGISAIAIASLSGLAFMAILGAAELYLMLDIKPDAGRNVLRPLLAAALSGLLCLVLDRVFKNLIGEILTFLVAFILSYILYMVLLIVLRAADRYDVEKMPFGDQFALIADRFNGR